VLEVYFTKCAKAFGKENQTVVIKSRFVSESLFRPCLLTFSFKTAIIYIFVFCFGTVTI
jgi:hypothetical protein